MATVNGFAVEPDLQRLLGGQRVRAADGAVVRRPAQHLVALRTTIHEIQHRITVADAGA